LPTPGTGEAVGSSALVASTLTALITPKFVETHTSGGRLDRSETPAEAPVWRTRASTFSAQDATGNRRDV
jgi:hypothetical protein